MLQAGIVGLPNVGKSTLFNAVTRTRKAQAANYPFCTIDPNVGMVTVPDSRLQVLSDMSGSEKIIPTLIEFVDIAGLVKGASEGAGLGNQFLANIREVDAIVQVVRCFDNDDIIHELGSVDPLRDIEIINSELILADIATMDKRLSSRERKARSGDKEAKAEVALITKLLPHLNEGNPALTFESQLDDDERKLLHSFQLLSDKKSIFACNVNEDELADAINNPDAHPYVSQVKKYVAEHHNAEAIVISARIEEELIDVSDEEAREFLESLGVQDSGVSDPSAPCTTFWACAPTSPPESRKRGPGPSRPGPRPPRRRASSTRILNAASSLRKWCITTTWYPAAARPERGSTASCALKERNMSSRTETWSNSASMFSPKLYRNSIDFS